MNDTSQNPTKILLHACCGPCSMEPVRVLRENGTEPVIYYANSNIHPDEEYARRLETLSFWAKDESLEVIEGSYDPAAWEETAGRIGEAAREKFGVITHEANNDPLPEDSENRAGRNDCDAEGRESDGHDGHDSEGSDNDGHDDSSLSAASEAELARQARCRACYRLRFEETAQYAAEHGIEAIGTTLSVSPYQYTAIIREELQRAAMRAGVKAHFEDYRPFYDNATRRSRDAGMYRQNYCACRFSDEEAQFEREERKRARKEAKAAEAAARAEQQSAELAAANAKRAEKAAYADKQARKRALLKQLREQQGSNG